ncbi:MAG TPA: ParB/RepB/Spo0J family partition protein [Gemmatimonadales bacterium]|jgi:ParB family chromosome partitioning protein
MSETKRLGRGLEALLGPVARHQAEPEGAMQELPVDAIRPNPYQPRIKVDEAALQELVTSIQASGLLQPVVVRAHADGYQLIAGERRWRAVQRLGWRRIPAVIREADDRTLLTLALVENLQRDNLSPVETARSYQRLIDEFQASPAEVGELVGKDRSTVANALRLLRLPSEVREMLEDGRLSEGHARALLGVSDTTHMSRLAKDAAANGWTVRDTESRVREGRTPRNSRRPTGPQEASAEHRRVEDALRKRLGTDVRVTARRKGRGLIALSYYSNDDLARLLELLLGRPFEG